MMTDPISDMLTRIRNASMVGKRSIELPHSKIKFAIAKILQREGYVGTVERFEDGNKLMLRVGLQYNDTDMPAISSVKRISKPGRRVYVKADKIPQVRSGFGFAIISTPNGLMTNSEARKRRLGGEVICEVF
ncbi:30S ribosomal protein S8 [Patescibacteria group bacterium]|nr:30S ribosomal protein S8 [Patescibacteria group bacterium]